MSNKQDKKFRKAIRQNAKHISETISYQEMKKLVFKVARQRDICFIIAAILVIGLIFKFIF